MAARMPVVYVDHDPVGLAPRVRCCFRPEGVTSYIDADARVGQRSSPAARATLDFRAPIAFIMVDLPNLTGDDGHGSPALSPR